MSITSFILLVRWFSSTWWSLPNYYFQPNLWHSGWVGTGNRILDLYLIIFLSSVHIWNHPIITTNKKYLFLWCMLPWYASGVNVLAHIIISSHQENDTCFHLQLMAERVVPQYLAADPCTFLFGLIFHIDMLIIVLVWINCYQRLLFCDLYKFKWWYYMIELRLPGLEWETKKAYQQ